MMLRILVGIISAGLPLVLMNYYLSRLEGFNEVGSVWNVKTGGSK